MYLVEVGQHVARDVVPDEGVGVHLGRRRGDARIPEEGQPVLGVHLWFSTKTTFFSEV